MFDINVAPAFVRHKSSTIPSHTIPHPGSPLPSSNSRFNNSVPDNISSVNHGRSCTSANGVPQLAECRSRTHDVAAASSTKPRVPYTMPEPELVHEISTFVAKSVSNRVPEKSAKVLSASVTTFFSTNHSSADASAAVNAPSANITTRTSPTTWRSFFIVLSAFPSSKTLVAKPLPRLAGASPRLASLRLAWSRAHGVPTLVTSAARSNQ
jgi:hypothetical protein